MQWWIDEHSLQISILNAQPDADVVEAERIVSGTLDARVPSPRSTNWWLGRMIASHSSLRCVRFRIVWRGIRSDAAREIGAKTGMAEQLAHPQFEGISATDVLLDTDSEGWLRLCGSGLCSRVEGSMQTAIQAAADQMRESFDPFFQALGALSVPRCERTLRCPELRGCGLHPRELQRWGGV
jgi:hypothetical protein